MAGESDYSNIVAEVLTAELCADTECASEFQNFFFKFYIAEGVASFRIALERKRI